MGSAPISKGDAVRLVLAAVCILGLLAPAPVRPEEPPVFVRHFGRGAPGAAGLGFPSGVAVDDSGNAYVAERGVGRVSKFDPDGQFLLAWSGSAESGPLVQPTDVEVDHAGRVWVADPLNNRIVWFTSEGQYLGAFGSTADSALSSPNGLGLHPVESFLYVADTFHGRVRKLDISGSEVTVADDYGVPGTDPGAMQLPSDVAVSTNGEIHIAEPGLNRIQIFSPEGRFRLALGRTGGGPGRFNAPVGIALDRNDDIYVVDSANGRIQKFGRDAVFVLQWGQSGSKEAQLNQPMRMAITPAGLAYICDVNSSSRIAVFQLDLPTAVERRTWTDVRRLYRR
jgi:DNA-binding beta-propeller fold protein YncE